MGLAVTLTAAMVAEATGGHLANGDARRAFSSVAIDTRTLTEGTLFVALRGERFDAHAFLREAVDRGAAGVLVEVAPDLSGDVVVIVVPDTLGALQALARAVRRASGARVVAITGSAGKTTTKEIAADLLMAGGLRVLRNRGNLNNHIGLPLSLMELTAGVDVAVVELGMNHAGEIRTLVSIAEPELRVWTNVGDAHVGHFGSREALAAAKAEILEHAGADAVVIANADDPLVMARVARSSIRHVTFGESAGADVRAVDVLDQGFDGVRATVVVRGQTASTRISLAGRANLSNVLAGLAVAVECGLGLDTLVTAVAELRPVPRRGASHRLRNGARIVDDSYNASPAALESALAALAATPVSGRRVAVVGEMLELGDAANDLHETCGRAVVEAGVTLLVAVGGTPVDALVRGALAAGLPPDAVHRFADSTTAATAIGHLIADGDVVLVKGSRGIRTDLVVDQLMAVA